MGLLWLLANLTSTVWLLSGLTFLLTRQWTPAFRWLYLELRPLYVPCWIIGIVHNVIQGDFVAGGWTTFWAILNVPTGWLCWKWYKDFGDDDRWKRRRRRVTESIKRVGSRLVPAPVSSR